MVRHGRFASTGLLFQVFSTEGIASACSGSVWDEEPGWWQGDGEAELLPSSLQCPVCQGSLLQKPRLLSCSSPYLQVAGLFGQ